MNDVISGKRVEYVAVVSTPAIFRPFTIAGKPLFAKKSFEIPIDDEQRKEIEIRDTLKIKSKLEVDLNSIRFAHVRDDQLWLFKIGRDTYTLTTLNQPYEDHSAITVSLGNVEIAGIEKPKKKAK